jgi:hypothetical protein
MVCEWLLPKESTTTMMGLDHVSSHFIWRL